MAGVFHRFVSSDRSKSEAAELFGDFHSNGSLIDFAGSINVGQSAVIGTMADQVVGDPHQGAANAAIRLADDGAAIVVGLIALMP